MGEQRRFLSSLYLYIYKCISGLMDHSMAGVMPTNSDIHNKNVLSLSERLV